MLTNNSTIHQPSQTPLMETTVGVIFKRGSPPFILLFSCIGLLIFLGNLMVCYAFFRVKSLRTKTNKFVISTSVSGIFIGLLFVPFFVVLDDVIASISTDVIPASSFLASFLGFSLLFNIGALTYERHVAVFHSLEYNCVITHRIVNRLLFVVWLIPLFLSTMPAVFPYMIADTVKLYTCFKIYQGFLSSLLTIVLLAFFVVYIRIWKASLFHLAFDRKQRLSIRSAHFHQIKELRSMPNIFRCFNLKRTITTATETATLSERGVENRMLLQNNIEYICHSNNESNDIEQQQQQQQEFAKVLTRRLSELSHKSSICSVTLNGEALEGDIKHKPLKRQSRFSIKTKGSLRKLSADWMPSKNWHVSPNRGQRLRKLSEPVKCNYNDDKSIKRPRLFSEGSLLPTLDGGMLFSSGNITDIKDNFERCTDTDGDSPESFHSCRSRVSFASLKSPQQPSQQKSCHPKQMKGIIKKNERKRRINYAPTHWRTLSSDRKQRPHFTKTKSLPYKTVFETMNVNMDDVWNDPLTPPNYRTTPRLQRSAAISQTSSQCSSRYDSPLDSSIGSPLSEHCNQTDYARRNTTFQNRGSNIESPTNKINFSRNTRQSLRSTVKTPTLETENTETLQSTNVKECPISHLQTEKPLPVTSEQSSDKTVPASVRRALYRLKEINGNWSGNSTSSGMKSSVDVMHCPSRISVTSRLFKSRNSVISQAIEFFKEIKHTRVIAVIVFINALCWLPLIFMNFADATGHTSLVTPNLIFTSHVLFLLNSLVMPYIYAFCKHDFKNVFRKFPWPRRSSNRF